MFLKAVALISGGLDSALAVKIIRLQGIDIFGLVFITPFIQKFRDDFLPSTSLGTGWGQSLQRLAQNLDIEIKLVDISEEYLDLVKNPCFGFGKNLNPCIDCHIFMLKKAKEFMLEYKANFIISGDVLGQRPMSQNKSALTRIEKEAGLEGLVLRPLSAGLLPPTIPEQNGWVERSRLFAFSGRSRKAQIELAKQLDLRFFSQPAGGCLLTDPGFSRRLRDLLTYKQEFDLDDLKLLKLGRHFRVSSQAKLILGRDKQENQCLISLVREDNIFLQPIQIPGPTGILKAEIVSEELLKLSAAILARYCDNNNGSVSVAIECSNTRKTISCSAAEPDTVQMLRI